MQQGSHNTLQQITPLTAQGAALQLLLAFQDSPPDVRKQAGDQLQDLQEELAAPTTKAYRILASLTTLLTLSGNDPEVWKRVAEVARQCGMSFPEVQHGPG
ncbi:hypothetical protein [Deinococcus roseus]|uniref:Uncharacterized protein n=1 Tax=Deinococcus roseus TaxID=392414 RepID=A0ABQ2D2V1_9DEIO|nr:hypothetical protein [Deinococcus roseus]GGJ43768.1 hypothetical protein GCM10008938_32580 [Deinococcus roseus]